MLKELKFKYLLDSIISNYKIFNLNTINSTQLVKLKNTSQL